MQQITKEEFANILESCQAENAERVEMGLEAYEVTTAEYDGLSAGSLVEYYFANTMFGFIQDGIYYSNGI